MRQASSVMTISPRRLREGTLTRSGTAPSQRAGACRPPDRGIEDVGAAPAPDSGLPAGTDRHGPAQAQAQAQGTVAPHSAARVMLLGRDGQRGGQRWPRQPRRGRAEAVRRGVACPGAPSRGRRTVAGRLPPAVPPAAGREGGPMAPFTRGGRRGRPGPAARGPAARSRRPVPFSSRLVRPSQHPTEVRGDRKASRPQRGSFVSPCVSRRSSRFTRRITTSTGSSPRGASRCSRRGAMPPDRAAAARRSRASGRGREAEHRREPGPPQGVGDETEPQPGRGCVRGHLKRGNVQGVHHEHVAVRGLSRRRSGS